ncbi:beta-galactosidase GalB [Sedimentisphaera salicampi]|uniref:Beta-galactosidase n=1 Tax=Sedimentisphaera salicampi TaxID=1941349 RepID=A0A1W6LP50_9BACT|nr:beta-galactosidase GalB [Sedimentisphaera salicampi]ARN57559.1 Beta-galactosidase [Sedimentisphaera salicampi]
MRKIQFAVLLCLSVSLFGGRERISFDQGWNFFRCGNMPDGTTKAEPEGLENPSFSDDGWRELNLPHDWAIEGPFRMDLPNRTGKLPYAGIGWYRKDFKLSKEDKHKEIYLMFDGAMSDTEVWVNGEYAGRWPYGYNSFYFNITEHLNYGEENVVAVRLDNKPDSSRWYPGGGIYRHTYLIKTEPVHVDIWGTFVTTPLVQTNKAIVEIKTDVNNAAGKDSGAEITHQIAAPDSGEIVCSESRKIKAQAGETEKTEMSLTVTDPHLWSVESPDLYTLITEIRQNGETVDKYETKFGIRSVKFTADEGLLINNEPVEIKGVCLHHDLGPLGAAIHKRAIERKLEILQEMGCNAIRTAHNPPSPELLELCDEMGFLVMDEAFDCWEEGKTENDYGRFFEEWHKKDVTNLVRRDRNHPSVIFWSSGNEVKEQRQGEEGREVSRKLTGIFHELDPTRPVTVGCNSWKSGFNGFQKTVDIIGFNYKPHIYGKFAEENPNMPFLSSESASCVSSMGEYFFPVKQKKDQGFFQFHVSSYDLYAPSWASRPDLEFEGQDRVPQCIGEFVWTGFDYIGEPTPYNKDKTNLLNFQSEEEKIAMQQKMDEIGGKAPSRSSYFGIMDLCGFKKDRFYIYQARWRPEKPMVHILPHWNWPERKGEITPVHVYTSGDEAELFLNGTSLGRKKKGEYQYRLVWDEVKYQAGELRAVAYKDGKKWASEVVTTTNEPAKIELEAGSKTIKADGSDLSFVKVKITDNLGKLVPRSDNMVYFEIEGPGEIAAVGNGDQTSHEPFQASRRKAFNGLCLAIIRSYKGETGEIKLTAKSRNLSSDSAVITVE